jgi:hypothetical protein
MENASNAGLEPDEFARWREAGVDSWNIAEWSRVLSRAGLGPDAVKRWRASRLNFSMLPLIVPYLSAELDFEGVLVLLQTWDVPKNAKSRTPRAEELLRVLETRIDVGDLVRIRKAGVNGPQLLRWCSSGVPAGDWAQWITTAIPPDTAGKFFASGTPASTAVEWMAAGLSAAAALTLIEQQVSLSTVHEWIGAGVSASDAASFIGVGASIATAREWLAANLSAETSAEFIGAGVPLTVAREWIESDTELSVTDCVDFINKRVSLSEALEFERRGIGAQQVTRTDDGIELDLDPWQEDPADQLPSVVQAGAISFTLWTSALGGDPVAHDLSFNWDGLYSARWSEDISTINELSFASSSPVYGVVAWPDGHDVELTYTWSDLGMEGFDELTGVAPTSDHPKTGANDPRQWVRLGDALLDFVLLGLGSGGMSSEKIGSEYYDKVRGTSMDIHDMFVAYLAETTKSDVRPSFDQWLDIATNVAGAYEIVNDADY